MRYIGILPGYNPAGNNTEIQYNNNGALGANSNLTFDGTTLNVTGDMAVTGNVTKTGIPLFYAENSTDRPNVTGDNSLWTVIYDTEIVDQGSDFNTSTYTFTAPVTGTYLLRASVSFGNRTSSSQWASGVYITTSNRSYRVYDEHVNASTSNDVTTQTVAIADMDASDTAYVIAYFQGGTKTITGRGNGPDTSFSGYLIG